MTITIKDIARAAGVSHTTVSRALRGHPGIATQTVARIQKIAEELGYVPNTVARGLKTKRSGVLGVIVRRIDDPFFGPVLQGIEDVLHADGYSLFLAASHRDAERERSIVQAMSERRVDGVIICSTQVSQEHQHLLEHLGVVSVLINNQSSEDIKHSVYHDDAFGSAEATRHLIELGHSRIAYLGNARAGRTTEERLRGYKQAMSDRGIPVRPDYIRDAPNGVAKGGALGAEYFLQLSPRPTAIVAYNDVMAIGAIQRLRQASLHIPGDCSVTGFDDIDLAAYVHPPLTTFGQPKNELGREAAQMMLRLLRRRTDGSSGDKPDIAVLRGQLKVRGSTAPPANY